MNNEQRIQQHNEMVRAQLRAEAQAEADKRTHKRAQERLSRQINCVQNRSHGQSDREKWGHTQRTQLVDWDVNNDEASSGSLTPSKDHVDDASPCD